MPTENRSSNNEMVSVQATIEALEEAHAGDGALDFMNDAAQLLRQFKSQPAEQHQDEYPPCDYCGTVPTYHPWHGSGMLNGVENRHIHACDGCRGKLPVHPGQHQGGPVLTLQLSDPFDDRDGPWFDSAELRALSKFPAGTRLYTHADPGEIERLRAALKFYAEREHYHFESGNWDTVSGEPLNILWCGDEPDFIEDGSVARAALSASAEPKS
ncbi:hypothetical protein ACNFIC_02570 [Pseudomonas sp. NY15463]|uniref:hypothetical protein n=1 Tax=Pseudomonas sp. NY15463 TaxID=3400361 RepID=UPI003A8A9568